MSTGSKMRKKINLWLSELTMLLEEGTVSAQPLNKMSGRLQETRGLETKKRIQAGEFRDIGTCRFMEGLVDQCINLTFYYDQNG